MRNGRSVTPAMGATNRLFANSWEPMRMGEKRREGAAGALLKNEARIVVARNAGGAARMRQVPGTDTT